MAGSHSKSPLGTNPKQELPQDHTGHRLDRPKTQERGQTDKGDQMATTPNKQGEPKGQKNMASPPNQWQSPRRRTNTQRTGPNRIQGHKKTNTMQPANSGVTDPAPQTILMEERHNHRTPNQKATQRKRPPRKPRLRATTEVPKPPQGSREEGTSRARWSRGRIKTLSTKEKATQRSLRQTGQRRQGTGHRPHPQLNTQRLKASRAVKLPW